jgi:hypothetical protein
MPLTFAALKANYPLDEHEQLFKSVLGGGFADLISNPEYKNTCAMRMSVALLRSGVGIPANLGAQDGGHKDKNEDYILTHVSTMNKMLTQIFGAFYWGMNKQPGDAFDFTLIPSFTGVLLYEAKFSDATGHVDLWNKDACWNNCPDIDLARAYAVSFWKVD